MFLIVALATACTGGGDSDAPPVLVDEHRGLYGDVGIGSTSSEVRARFGEPDASAGFIPLEPDGVKGPYSFSTPGNVTPDVLRYERIAFVLAGDRVFGFVTSDQGAVLRRQVGVGDSLPDFRAAYPVSCRQAYAGESPFGGERTYTLCRLPISGLILVATKNPVESIALLDLSPPIERRRPLRIDERRGTVNGVGIGDSVGELWRVFGNKRKANPNREPAGPLRARIGDYEGPTHFRLGPPFYRYHDVTFFVSRQSRRISGFMVVGAAVSATGIKTGDDLDRVRDAYPDVRCGDAPIGDEGGAFPACAGEIAPGRYAWFGGDPISNVTVGVAPLRGVG